MQYFISIMCTHNAQPIITLLLLCFNSSNSHEFIKKELTVQVTSKRSCVCCSRLSGTKWAYKDHVWTQAMSLPPPPICLQPLSGTTRALGVGRGGAAVGHLLPPVLRPHSLTALTHHICQLLLSYLIGHPSTVWRETPLSEPPEPEMSPPLEQRSFGGGGGGVAKEWRRA
jgi:hypothetical protein